MAATKGARRVGLAAIVLLAGAVVPSAAVVLRARQAALPDGRGKPEFERVCAGCHPAEDAVKGGRRSREGWQRVVDDMVVRGAEGSDDDLKLVVEYLTERFGPSSGGREGEPPSDGQRRSARWERGTACGISRSRWPR